MKDFVSPLLNPSRCVPPSAVWILLTKDKIFSLYAVVYWSATSTWTSFCSVSKYITSLFIGSLDLFKYSTKDFNPPS